VAFTDLGASRQYKHECFKVSVRLFLLTARRLIALCWWISSLVRVHRGARCAEGTTVSHLIDILRAPAALEKSLGNLAFE
jgi:hypothetical protein